MRNRFNEPCLCGVSSEADQASFLPSVQSAASNVVRKVSALPLRMAQAFQTSRDARERERLNRTRLG